MRRNNVGRQPTAAEKPPRELFEQLKRREKQLNETGFKRMSTEAAKARFLTVFPFVPDRAHSEEARDWLADDAHKYQFLLKLLRNYNTKEGWGYVLANLLYQEGIGRPEDLLGKQFSKYARAAFHGPRGRVSMTSLRQAFIVETWVPYFEKLLHDKAEGRDLQELGYDETVIRAAEHKTAAVAAACAWLAPRFSITPAALANAHSKTYAAAKSMPSSGLATKTSRTVS